MPARKHPRGGRAALKRALDPATPVERNRVRRAIEALAPEGAHEAVAAALALLLRQPRFDSRATDLVVEGVARSAAGDKRAYDTWDRLERLGPDEEIEACLGLAVMALFDDAPETALDKVSDLEDDTARVIEALALVQGDVMEDVLDVPSLLLNAQPDRVDSLLAVARIYAISDQPQSALEIARRAAALAPDDDEVAAVLRMIDVQLAEIVDPRFEDEDVRVAAANVAYRIGVVSNEFSDGRLEALLHAIGAAIERTWDAEGVLEALGEALEAACEQPAVRRRGEAARAEAECECPVCSAEADGDPEAAVFEALIGVAAHTDERNLDEACSLLRRARAIAESHLGYTEDVTRTVAAEFAGALALTGDGDAERVARQALGAERRFGAGARADLEALLALVAGEADPGEDAAGFNLFVREAGTPSIWDESRLAACAALVVLLDGGAARAALALADGFTRPAPRSLAGCEALRFACSLANEPALFAAALAELAPDTLESEDPADRAVATAWLAHAYALSGETGTAVAFGREALRLLERAGAGVGRSAPSLAFEIANALAAAEAHVDLSPYYEAALGGLERGELSDGLELVAFPEILAFALQRGDESFALRVVRAGIGMMSDEMVAHPAGLHMLESMAADASRSGHHGLVVVALERVTRALEVLGSDRLADRERFTVLLATARAAAERAASAHAN